MSPSVQRIRARPVGATPPPPRLPRLQAFRRRPRGTSPRSGWTRSVSADPERPRAALRTRPRHRLPRRPGQPRHPPPAVRQARPAGVMSVHHDADSIRRYRTAAERSRDRRRHPPLKGAPTLARTPPGPPRSGASALATWRLPAAPDRARCRLRRWLARARLRSRRAATHTKSSRDRRRHSVHCSAGRSRS